MCEGLNVSSFRLRIHRYMCRKQNDKKQEELQYAKNLMSMLSYKIDSYEAGADPPDIDIKINSKAIGLEITKILNENYYSEYAYIETLLKDVEIEYSKRYPINKFHVYVTLSEIKICKTEKYSLLTDIVKSINDYFELSIKENKYFSRIEICARNTEIFRIFPFYGAGYELSLNDSLVKTAVCKKEEALYRYQSLYNECWLLLVLPFTKSVTAGYFMPDYLEQPLSRIESQFDRVYVMSNNKVECLK